MVMFLGSTLSPRKTSSAKVRPSVGDLRRLTLDLGLVSGLSHNQWASCVLHAGEAPDLCTVVIFRSLPDCVATLPARFGNFYGIHDGKTRYNDVLNQKSGTPVRGNPEPYIAVPMAVPRTLIISKLRTQQGVVRGTLVRHRPLPASAANLKSRALAADYSVAPPGASMHL